MPEWLTAVVDNYPTVINGLLTIVAGATVITAVTPTQWDNKAVNMISKLLNVLAGNVGRNRNADDPEGTS